MPSWRTILPGAIAGAALAVVVAAGIGAMPYASVATVQMTVPASVGDWSYADAWWGVRRMALSEKKLAMLVAVYNLYPSDEPSRKIERLRGAVSTTMAGERRLVVSFRHTDRKTAQHITAWIVSGMLTNDHLSSPVVELVEPASVPREHPSIPLSTLIGATAGVAVAVFSSRRL